MNKFFVSILLFIATFKLFAQTSLVPGDIAFSGYTSNTLSGDEFSFVLLKNISAGTSINFTDNGWLGAPTNTFRTGETTVTWVSPSALVAGIEIKINGTTATFVGGGPAGSVTGTALSLSTVGDQVLAYQGSVSSPTFISAIHMNVFVNGIDPFNFTSTSAVWDGSVNSVSGSGLPPGLTTSINAIWIGVQAVSSSEFDNSHFTGCNLNLSTIALTRSALNDMTNWTSDNLLPPGFLLPTACPYLTSPCITPTLSLSGQTNVLCNGGSTGSATMSASGGSPFTYTWSPSGGNAATATGLSAGIYTCVTTNSCGSTALSTVQITQPASALATATAVTNVLCFGGSTGSATVTASGGTPGYTYLWSGAQTTSVISGQTAGVKTVTVTDANGCTSTKGVTVTQPGSALSTATAVTNVLCFGNSTGAATVNASGGTPGYTYLWNGAQTTSVISGQTAGVKTVTVTDANGCTSTKSVTVTQPGSGVSSSTTVTNILCNGNSTGAATVMASGGSPGYTYLWSGAQTTSVISGQTAGVKTVTVTDINGCTNVNSVSITQPALLSATQSQTNITCVINGAGNVNVSGGAGSYTHSWSPSGGTGSTAISLSAGNYTCEIKDANLCSLLKTFTITSNTTPPSVAISGTNQICNGQSVLLTASGATSYSWSTGAVTSTIAPSPVTTSTYIVTGTNSVNGCTNIATQIVTVNALPTISVNSGTICSGQSFTIIPNGANTYTIQGGSAVVSPTATSSYTVIGTSIAGCISPSFATSNVTVIATPTLSITNGTICPGNSFTLNPLGANTYTYLNGGSIVTPTISNSYSVIGTSSTGCVSSNTAIAVITVTNINVTITGSNTICSGQSAFLIANGATTYSWSNGPITNTIAPTPTINTTYSVTGISGSCTNTAQFNLTVNALPSLSITGNPVICDGATVNLTASGANTYSWSMGPTTNTIAVTPTTNVTYSVTGLDINGCSNIAVQSVTVNPTPTLSVNNGTICPGGSFTISPSGANTYTYLPVGPIVSPIITSSYSITGTSVFGCVTNTAVVSVITVTNNLAVSITGSITICEGETANLIANGASTYTWSTGANAATITPTPSVNTTYSVIGASGTCSNTASVSVIVNPNPTVTAISNLSLICIGQSVNLSANGASTYSWSTGSTNQIITVSPTVTSTYTVVGSFSGTGCSNSAIITQSVDACTSINKNFTQNAEIKVYPNPVNNKLTIVTNSIEKQIIIYNSLGEISFMIEINNERTEVDLTSIPNGIYFIKINNTIKKIIKE
ncbi:MAG: T9SS type A sorting domain-containing protein [Bacteroidia bacterium]|nr:T9SS type A sorting domain-containing protein [Bacteroidia bacterium]